MIIRPSNMSRRGFLRNVLGIATVIALPVAKQILRPMPYKPFARSVDTAGIRGISHSSLILDELDEEGIDMSLFDDIQKQFLDRVGVPRGLVNGQVLFKGTAKQTPNPFYGLTRPLDPRYKVRV